VALASRCQTLSPTRSDGGEISGAGNDANRFADVKTRALSRLKLKLKTIELRIGTSANP